MQHKQTQNCKRSKEERWSRKMQPPLPPLRQSSMRRLVQSALSSKMLLLQMLHTPFFLSKARTIEGKTIASIVYHKTDWPSADLMSGSWMSLYILGLTIVDMVRSRLCPFSPLLSPWRLALMKLDHDNDLEKRRQLLNWNQNHRWVTLAFNNFHKIAMKYLIPMKILLILQKMK